MSDREPKSDQLTLRFPASLLRQAAARMAEQGTRTISEQIRRDLEAFYGLQTDRLDSDRERLAELLSRERRSLRRLLTGAEVALIVDVSSGTFWDAASVGAVWQEVEDALPDDLAEKWGVDGPALVEKLRGLRYGGAWALADATERFWALVRAGEQPDPRQALEDAD